MELLDIVSMSVMGKPAWAWVAFMTLVVALLVLDLGVLHRKTHEISIPESLKLSAFYIAVALAYGGWVWWYLGDTAGMNYLTAYFVEKSLSLDNVFVISLVFTYFAIPRLYQHRVLFWGILGVIFLRGIMIGAGAALIEQFHWILYLFGGFLIITGIKMLIASGDDEPDMSKNKVIAFLRRHLRVTDQLHGDKFWVHQPDPKTGHSIRWATPLFLALVVVEISDLVFAVDSVPAVFAITTDPFVVYTSNIFAILGLRALYFALAAMVHRFEYLKYALAAVLIFIGGKIFYASFVGKVPALISLGVTFGLLAAGVVVSLLRTKPDEASEKGGSV
ncbi:TerC family protein [Insolitispirillum peregrinum]|uniref:Tellurite resistance protein TerC n=1 Tax=Insolitispirillum peregrinum TaxID=80876 RepID=A0A1N7NID0_9PROT|nr:TerC family protein [Insolitispirillum peregrinum]SIS98050.1 tellurite resistance protein TerC [Insolitispirillum peregrinum]